MKKVIRIALLSALLLLACTPEEVGVQVDTVKGKLDKISNIPEMTRQDFNVMRFIGGAKSLRELEPQLFMKNRWELLTEAGERPRTIVNEKDADEIIGILSYQVVVSDSNVGIVTAINKDSLHDDRIGKIIVYRTYVKSDGLYGIQVFATVNHPGKALMSYINCREVALKENTVEMVNENIALDEALTKHRRWITQNAEGGKISSPTQSSPPNKLSDDELRKLPPLMRLGR
jgi:hypothetical protein